MNLSLYRSRATTYRRRVMRARLAAQADCPTTVWTIRPVSRLMTSASGCATRHPAHSAFSEPDARACRRVGREDHTDPTRLTERQEAALRNEARGCRHAQVEQMRLFCPCGAPPKTDDPSANLRKSGWSGSCGPSSRQDLYLHGAWKAVPLPGRPASCPRRWRRVPSQSHAALSALLVGVRPAGPNSRRERMTKGRRP